MERLDAHKSPSDRKNYGMLTLENGLRVLLIAEGPSRAGEGEQLCAAALAVSVGSLLDPPDVQGCAHFLEHMLFMGSKDFPQENAFDAFLSEHGGGSNAFTEMEFTTYHFTVGAPFLEGALARFAAMFRAPLWAEDGTDRECQAIESEFQASLLSDSARRQQVFCHHCRPTHPLHSFAWGNWKSLREIPQEHNVDIRARLIEFHRQYYSAHRMHLVVRGPYTLEELESHVRRHFETIPRHDDVSAPSQYANLEHRVSQWPADPSEWFNPLLPTATEAPKEAPLAGTDVTPSDCAPLPHAVRLSSVKDALVIRLVWTWPSQRGLWAHPPAEYLGHVLGHEGPGSLLSSLRAKGFATGLVAGGGTDGVESNALYDSFMLHVHATESGMARWVDVCAAVFAYLGMMEQHGPSEPVYEEMRRLAWLRFRFEEDEEPEAQVERLAGVMASEGTEDIVPPAFPADGSTSFPAMARAWSGPSSPAAWLAGESYLAEYSEQVEACIRECVQLLTPSRVRVELLSKDGKRTMRDRAASHASSDARPPRRRLRDMAQDREDDSEEDAGDSDDDGDSHEDDDDNDDDDGNEDDEDADGESENDGSAAGHGSDGSATENSDQDDGHSGSDSNDDAEGWGRGPVLRTTHSEPWFGTKFGLYAIGQGIVEHWDRMHRFDFAAKRAFPRMQLPVASPFVPEDLTIRNALAAADGEVASSVHGTLPRQLPCDGDARGKLWFLPDRVFQQPRTYLDAMVYFPMCIDGVDSEGGWQFAARRFLRLSLWAKHVSYLLIEVSYLAEIADLHLSIRAHWNGLHVSLHGFHDKLPVLLRIVTGMLLGEPHDALEELAGMSLPRINGTFAQSAFRVVKERFKRSLRNRMIQPTQQARHERLRCILHPTFPLPYSLDILPELSLEEVLTSFHAGPTSSLSRSLWEGAFVEMLVHGNETPESAKVLYDIAAKPVHAAALCGSSTTCTPQTRTRAVQLPAGPPSVRRVVGSQPDQSNEVVELYWQWPDLSDSTESRVLLDLLETMLHEPIFDQLRTKQQLGYTIASSARRTGGVLGYLITVQSDAFTPAHVTQRVEEFLQSWRDDLAAMPEAEIFQYVDSLCEQKARPDTALHETNDRWWEFVSEQEYDFCRIDEEIKALSLLRAEDSAAASLRSRLLTAFDALFGFGEYQGMARMLRTWITVKPGTVTRAARAGSSTTSDSEETHAGTEVTDPELWRLRNLAPPRV